MATVQGQQCFWDLGHEEAGSLLWSIPIFATGSTRNRPFLFRFSHPTHSRRPADERPYLHPPE